jgi:hypothetical protein
MSIGNLIFDLPVQTKNIVRYIEKTNKKIVNKTNSLVFNETCLKEEILPTYTNIYIYICNRLVSGTWQGKNGGFGGHVHFRGHDGASRKSSSLIGRPFRYNNAFLGDTGTVKWFILNISAGSNDYALI